MKKAFYIYWFVYLILMAVNLSGLTAPLWVAKLFDVSLTLTYIYLGFMPMYMMYVYGEKLNDIDQKYLEAIIVSFMVRSILFVFSIYGLDSRYDILTFFGGFMLVYYICEIRLKIKAIDKTLL